MASCDSCPLMARRSSWSTTTAPTYIPNSVAVREPYTRVRTEHMIVGQEVIVAEILGGLSVVSDHCRVGTYLSLRESHAYLHTQPPSRYSSRIHS